MSFPKIKSAEASTNIAAAAIAIKTAGMGVSKQIRCVLIGNRPMFTAIFFRDHFQGLVISFMHK